MNNSRIKTSNVTRKFLGPLILAWAIAACSPEVTVTEPPPNPPDGPWQAEIVVPGGVIETAFELSKTDTGYNASLVNGQERLSIDEVSYSGGELLLRFPVFNNEIRAQYVDGGLTGELILVKRFGELQKLPFSATPGSEHQHGITAAAPAIDMSGRWAASFINEDGSTSPSIGEFAQRGSRLFGTFVNVEGDHRYLSGHVSAQQFELSTFDGAHAFLFRGTVQDDSIIDGHFWSGSSWHQDWTAARNANASLPDAFSTTHLRPDYDQLSFSFPDHEGELVSLEDDKFKNKVVVVALAGTWCPNCNDEARFLGRIDGEYRDDDVAIVALMFEHFEDYETAAGQVQRFRAKHNIEYETLIAGVSDKTAAGEKIPELDAVMAFPTTIFIDRQHKVRTIHTGFSGPGTGEHHESLKSEFRRLINVLVAEAVVDPEIHPEIEEEIEEDEREAVVDPEIEEEKEKYETKPEADQPAG